MKDFSGSKTTPKVLTERILMDAITCKLEFIGEDESLLHLTPTEKDKVYRQTRIISARLARVLHYIPASFNWTNNPV